jgi:hypothetical protein
MDGLCQPIDQRAAKGLWNRAAFPQGALRQAEISDAAAGAAPSWPDPASVPKRDLVVSWENVLAGLGSTTLKYVAPGRWRSECSQQLLYSLEDRDGVLVFEVTYFLSGGCPDGQKQRCRYPGRAPFTLVCSFSASSPYWHERREECCPSPEALTSWIRLLPPARA